MPAQTAVCPPGVEGAGNGATSIRTDLLKRSESAQSRKGHFQKCRWLLWNICSPVCTIFTCMFLQHRVLFLNFCCCCFHFAYILICLGNMDGGETQWSSLNLGVQICLQYLSAAFICIGICFFLFPFLEVFGDPTMGRRHKYNCKKPFAYSCFASA